MIVRFCYCSTVCFFIFSTIFQSCKNPNPPKSVQENSAEVSSPEIPIITPSVVKIYPHDTTLFTEGFVYHDGKIFESSGASESLSYTNSVVGSSDLQTGKFDRKITIDKNVYFGEGIVFLNNKLYQLTWQNHIGFIYDAQSFKQTGTFGYPTAGWAITTDGKNLIMDDSTNHLTYLSPETLKPVKVLNVTRDGLPQDSLNELEYIKGNIYANIWYRNEIVKIDTATGKITEVLNLNSVAGDAKLRHPDADVLNGIAYDSLNDKIYITGKLWQNIYEINFPH